jgi:hypothetical protein
MLGLRGLGDTVTYDAAGNPIVVTSSPITVDTVTASGANVYQNSTGQVIGTSSPLLPGTSNTTLLYVGAGAVAVLLLLMAVKR